MCMFYCFYFFVRRVYPFASLSRVESVIVLQGFMSRQDWQHYVCSITIVTAIALISLVDCTIINPSSRVILLCQSCR